MKLLLLCIAVLLEGCAQTRVYSPAGKLVLETAADAKTIRYQGPDFAFSSSSLDHSTPTLAQGKATSDKLTAAGSAVAASGAMILLK